MFGRRPAIVRAAGRLADLGFDTVAPDLFDGQTTTDVVTALALRDGWETPRLLDHLAEVVDRHAGQEPPVLIGWSWGASTAVRLALSGCPVRALVLFHGLTGAPAPGCSALSAPVAVHVADADPFLTPAEVEEAASGLRAVGADVTVSTYRCDTHLFTDAEHPDHDPVAAHSAWKAAERFLLDLTATNGAL